MERYAELTNDLGERVTSVVSRVRDAQVKAIKRVRTRVELPSRLRQGVESLRTIARANHELRRQLLEARRDYVLGMFDALTVRATPRKRAAKA